MTHAIVLHEHGGPEQLKYEPIEVGKPGAGEVRIRHTGIGVNYIDTYFRSGAYPIALPAVIGDQAVGVIEEVGPAVDELSPGTRIAYGASVHAYCEERIIDAKDIVALPDNIEEEIIAATFTRGLTAEYLLCRLHELKAEETIIVHAATGGTGLIICQWARHIGARIIATVGSESKMEAARAAGADHVLLHGADDFVEQVNDITAGKGVDVAYDSIGLSTVEKSIECVRARGLMVTFGNSSGKPVPFDVSTLARLGSLFLTRPRLYDYVATRAELEMASKRYFDLITRGVLKPNPPERFALKDAADAHRHLEDRTKPTSPILVP